MAPGVVIDRDVDSRGREWERIKLPSGHEFILGPDLSIRVPWCRAHKSLSCWGALTFSERKSVSDAEPAPRERWEPAW